MAGKENGLPPFYRDIARLTGGCSEAIRERYIALEALERIGEVYYNRWLDTGVILAVALEDCVEAKAHFDAASEIDANDADKEEIYGKILY